MQSGTKRELCSARQWKPSAIFNSRTLSWNGVVLLNPDGIVGNTSLLFVEYSSSKYSTALVPRPANPSEPSKRIWKPWKFEHDLTAYIIHRKHCKIMVDTNYPANKRDQVLEMLETLMKIRIRQHRHVLCIDDSRFDLSVSKIKVVNRQI